MKLLFWRAEQCSAKKRVKLTRQRDSYGAANVHVRKPSERMEQFCTNIYACSHDVSTAHNFYLNLTMHSEHSECLAVISILNELIFETKISTWVNQAVTIHPISETWLTTTEPPISIHLFNHDHRESQFIVKFGKIFSSLCGVW